MMVSHAQNQNVLRRARDFYATYCASSDGKNYQGLPCPEWDKLTDAVRGHWYTVALRALQLEQVAIVAGESHMQPTLGHERSYPPNDYAIGHLPDQGHAFNVWSTYSGEV